MKLLMTAVRAALVGTLIPAAPCLAQAPAQSYSLPTTIADADRRVVRAFAADEAPRLDGVLDEDVWRTASPVTGFVQSEPDEGLPATQRTEVWVAYDATNLYLAAYLHDTDPGRLVINDIKRDFGEDTQDAFSVILDTFGDRRNGYIFSTNPRGAKADEQITNEGRETNISWDAPWSVQTRVTGDGWVVEMAIPLRTLRSAGGPAPTWGINFRRRIRRNNEVAHWAPIPRAYELSRVSLAGNLIGLSDLKGGLDLRGTPYVAGRTVRSVGGASYDTQGQLGADVKFGVTGGLTLDLTVNPDFAQVEADVQQVNLTQFSQFFPEKRDFFLENSGLFYVGDTPRNRRFSNAPRGDEDLLVFFSRRMGLSDEGNVLPIDAGLRLTGQEGNTQIGVLALRTRDRGAANPATDFGVVRLRQNVFGNSDVGALFMAKSQVGDRGMHNYVYGADANIRLPADIDWQSFVLNTEAPGVTGPRYAVQSTINREANFLHTKFSVLLIGENFTDELGFVRRTGIRKLHTDIGVRPRLASLRRIGIREMHPHIVWNYITDPSWKLRAKFFHSGYTFFLNNGGFAEVSVNPKTETLDDPLTIASSADPIPAGRHDWVEWMFYGQTDPSRLLSVGFRGTTGGLWTGTQNSLSLDGTIRVSYRLSATVGAAQTWADLGGANGKFTRALWTGQVGYSFSPSMSLGALVQYDPDNDLVNANVRFNLIHSPLSDLFIVYNEQRVTFDGAPVAGRSVIVKFTKMFAL
ncbi:MAG TPA: DUF5916 domain-containing protein [Gemmatimonadales bacterium]|jgi:hypothetical protein